MGRLLGRERRWGSSRVSRWLGGVARGLLGVAGGLGVVARGLLRVPGGLGGVATVARRCDLLLPGMRVVLIGNFLGGLKASRLPGIPIPNTVNIDF